MSISGVTVVGSDAPSDYHVAPRTTENPSQVSGSAAQIMTPQVVVSPTPATVSGAGIGALALVKKKRGRPRKYGPDGAAVPTALSPKPISSAAPSPSPVIDFSTEKRGKIRPVGFFFSCGEWVSCSVGANFTPHIITVNTGEDVTMKIISTLLSTRLEQYAFSQQMV
ncbi:hypothetical protein HAX54_051156 [Datura stramonium]|uniref:AT-hook motif nuclear-localized protein n=1 Tax=Datura stramonium TaxID=4076 RepID=A0ABS8SXB4_DATST|nr:hypothetical protein [Datura stramonium]